MSTAFNIYFLNNIIILRTWMAPYRDSVYINFRVSGPTTGSHPRNRCSIRRSRPAVLQCRLGRIKICISAPTAPSTFSSFHGSTIGIPACTRICRPIYRPLRRRRGPSGSQTTRHAPPRSEAFPRIAHRDLPSIAVRRNTCTICMNHHMEA